MSEVEVPKEEIEASRGLISYFVQTPVEAYNLLIKASNNLKDVIEKTGEYPEYEKKVIMYSIGKLFQMVNVITDISFIDLYNKYLSDPQIVRELLLKVVSPLADIYIKVLSGAYDDYEQLAKDIDLVTASLSLIFRNALELAAAKVNKSSEEDKP